MFMSDSAQLKSTIGDLVNISGNLGNGNTESARSELDERVLPELWQLAAKEGETFHFLVSGQTVTGFALDYKQAVDSGRFGEAQELANQYHQFAEAAVTDC